MTRLVAALGGVALGVLLALGAPARPAAAIPPRPRSPQALLPSGIGVDVGWGCCTGAEVATLTPAWYFDYWPEANRIDAPGILHVLDIPIWVAPAIAGIYAARYPGRNWTIGNEPNIPGTGDTQTPAAYTALARAQIAAIRGADPRARIIMAGLGNPDTAYAAAVLALTGPALFDAWNVHYYTAAPADYYAAVARYRAWMDHAGLADTALIVGEWGVPPGTDDATAQAFLRATKPLPAGVIAAAWFSVRSNGRWAGDLLDNAGQLTATGAVFRERLQAPARAPGSTCAARRRSCAR